VKLRQRAPEVEPVHCRADRDRLRARVRQRQLLRGAGQRLHSRHGRFELRAHLVERLDGDHARAGRDELARQLPGAGGDVDHSGSGPDPESLDDPVDELGQVARPAALVALRDLRERECRGAIQYAPRLDITAGSVFARIVMSSQIDQFSR
jgi:hypothetical protein